MILKIKFVDNAPLDMQLIAQLGDHQTLDLSGNSLEHRNIEELLSVINVLSKSKVREINLSSSGIQKKTAQELATFISALENTPVISINLSNNGLALQKTPNELDFGQNGSGFYGPEPVGVPVPARATISQLFVPFL